MKKKKVIPANYLERVPLRNEEIGWSVDVAGKVTLEVENKGIANKIAQKILKKPRISYIHLDDNGSFVWKIIDGESDLIKLGEKVEEHFGQDAHPLYERLAQFFQILERYGFITWKK